MNKIINIAEKEKAIKELTVFKENKYDNIDIKFYNVHLKYINEIARKTIFRKNDLFINSTTLWELMQPIGDSGSHNYHDLLPEDIVDAISSIHDPYCVFKVKYGRYAVVPVSISSFDIPLMVVIELKAGLVSNKKANINKIVTIYPKSEIDEILEKMDKKDIVYNKK